MNTPIQPALYSICSIRLRKVNRSMKCPTCEGHKVILHRIVVQAANATLPIGVKYGYVHMNGSITEAEYYTRCPDCAGGKHRNETVIELDDSVRFRTVTRNRAKSTRKKT